MLKKVQIFKALDIEIKKQKGPSAMKESYRGHHSLKEELSQPGISIIAEIAGGNPLRGQVRESYRASTHAKSLVENGARALSVATDRFLYFGEDKHLPEVRASVKVPLVRLDFIFEEYQVEESKILGADAIFLMAALLEPDRIKALRELAISKGLDVVVQVASEADLKRALEAEADIICVLGRDLDTWEPSWDRAIELMKLIPEKKCFRMIEVGISTLAQIKSLDEMGIHGVIIGDPLLDEFYPGKRLAQILAGVEPAKKALKAKPKAAPEAQTVAVVPSNDHVVPSHGAAKKPATVPSLTSNSLSHTAHKGKKESPMGNSQITSGEETSSQVDSATSSAPASSKKVAAKKSAPKKPAAKKAAPKKDAAKKPVVKKAAPKKVAPKKVAAKKPGVKKAAPKKVAAKKPVVKKAAPKKVAAKKPVVKKAAPKKVAAKKPVVKKAAPKKAAAKKAK